MHYIFKFRQIFKVDQRLGTSKMGSKFSTLIVKYLFNAINETFFLVLDLRDNYAKLM